MLVNTNVQRFTSAIFPAGNVLEMLGERGGNVEGGAVRAVSLEKAVMGTEGVIYREQVCLGVRGLLWVHPAGSRGTSMSQMGKQGQLGEIFR